MPRDLPGLYWNEDKQRYFPISSRPAGGQSRASTEAGPSTRVATAPLYVTQTSGLPAANVLAKRRKRQRLDVSSASPFVGYRNARNFAEINRAIERTIEHSIASLSEGKAFWYGDYVFSSLNVILHDSGAFVASTGDKGGWLQTYATNARGYPYGGSRELFLGSEVTSVCQSGTLRLAVSFGPASKVAVENTANNTELWTILNIGNGKCHDVHTAHLRGKSLVLGAAKRGILLSDIETSWSFTSLPAGSDVFSAFQVENVVYTGTRNGSIQCFDKRVQNKYPNNDLVGGRYKSTSSSITHLSVLDDWRLLVSTIRGDLNMFDLRFVKDAQPTMQFEGHVNEYTTRLGLATSPCGGYVFAAGQDCRIRVWSLHTGSPIPFPAHHQSITNSNSDVVSLSQPLPDPVTAMQVTRGGGGGGGSENGMTLWATSGKHIFRYWLGQRLDPAAMRY